MPRAAILNPCTRLPGGHWAPERGLEKTSVFPKQAKSIPDTSSLQNRRLSWSHIDTNAMGCPDPNVIAYCEDSETATVDQKRCKWCGICITLCTKDAMSVKQVNLNA